MIPLLIVALLVAPVMVACPKWCEDHYGSCACDQAPAESAVPVKPLDEKPSRHPQAAWERGEVSAQTPQSLQAQDVKQDKEQVDAEHAGKRAAGIN